MASMPESAIDSEVVPPSLSEIAPIIRVANEIEPEWPRGAYLCRFYAFEKAHKLDPNCSGRGVRRFKTALILRLERDGDTTLCARKKESDAREIQAYYQEYYGNYVKKLAQTAEQADRSELAKAYQTANILFELLRVVTQREALEVAPEILATGQDVKEKTEIFVPYNILPLDPGSANQAIMKLPEIRAVVTALHNTRALPWPENNQKPDQDLLDWLQVRFGFQKDNVANQREHLILLLANAHIRQHHKSADTVKLDDNALDEVMKKMFKNYKQWCKYLGRQSSLWLPNIQQDAQQRKILYMGLFLLIWGEAANLRFMPECLCYIYHHMAYQLYEILGGKLSTVTEDNFLEKVVTPIYEVISKEVKRNKKGTAEHSEWRNYDDLNEFFWSTECFSLGWPMHLGADFFNVPETSEKHPSMKKTGQRGGHTNKWMAKTNFVEIRSYWHLFRSFDRMWTFFILALQAMIIIAWHGTGSTTELFSGSVFKEVLSIFITASILKFLQGTYSSCLRS